MSVTYFSMGGLVARLRARGCHNANERRIRYLMSVGRVPTPELDERHCYRFTDAHVDQLLELLPKLPSAHYDAARPSMQPSKIC